ncbi:SAM-dependent methyltransferase [Rhodoplanes sp. Z2-YC6860]|uniref:SAM-dependent methyltransferase n=1 Tax=Rhodoplanes sp. Z2-YC6860 TaxID=674703 RepID=UPI00078ECEDF|nr:class I SAM-dependent methyltransferase [Rhodoplanes sp. Z2-YC6860]AMN44644.1 tellurite resistance protein TehB [Rhodoplanes sp. Z2-YC6860]
MSEFDRWEARFKEPGYHFGTEPNAFLKSKAHLLKSGQKALSIADGEGRNGVFLASAGLDVLAIDFSPSALKKAQALAKDRGVALRTELADLETWTWPDAAYDVVVGIFFQFLVPASRTRVFANIKRALKPGGLVLIEGYGLKQLEYKTGGPGVADQLYTRSMLQEAFGDFASVEITEYDAALSEGDRHVGMSALVDLVGRK